MGRWLDGKVTLTEGLIDEILTSYFETINGETNKIDDSLDVDEILKLKNILIKQILDCQNCCKNKQKNISYREIFFIVSKLYNISERDDNDVEITSEIYILISYFYEYITGKSPLT